MQKTNTQKEEKGKRQWTNVSRINTDNSELLGTLGRIDFQLLASFNLLFKAIDCFFFLFKFQYFSVCDTPVS